MRWCLISWTEHLNTSGITSHGKDSFHVKPITLAILFVRSQPTWLFSEGVPEKQEFVKTIRQERTSSEDKSDGFHLKCSIELWTILMFKLLLCSVCACVCVCVCVCVFVCVCVCMFILFHLLVSSGCTTSLTYMRSSDQRSFVVSILGASAKFLHLYFWIYLISPPKTKTAAIRLLERKRYDIMCADKDDIYWYRK